MYIDISSLYFVFEIAEMRKNVEVFICCGAIKQSSVVDGMTCPALFDCQWRISTSCQRSKNKANMFPALQCSPPSKLSRRGQCRAPLQGLNSADRLTCLPVYLPVFQRYS